MKDWQLYLYNALMSKSLESTVFLVLFPLANILTLLKITYLLPMRGPFPQVFPCYFKTKQNHGKIGRKHVLVPPWILLIDR